MNDRACAAAGVTRLNREIALVWRKHGLRGEEFRLQAEELRAG